jgi:hypothetical protein
MGIEITWYYMRGIAVCNFCSKPYTLIYTHDCFLSNLQALGYKLAVSIYMPSLLGVQEGYVASP